ncbi:MAG: methyltransferase domain-containing protein [candidate division WOR-3 bacterium]|jgi:S-adenosylmethionine-dependent methyltransferase
MKKFVYKVYKKLQKEQVPKNIKKNFIKIPDEKLKNFQKTLEDTFFKGWREKSNFSEKTFENDLKTQLYLRLNENRYYYIPWISKTFNLKDKKILEIGCGTGSSTVALSEQGASVTGIDIDKDSLTVAKERMSIYGLKAEFIEGNASVVFENIKDRKFDMIIFYASFEHMVYEERIDCLKKYFSFLEKGSFFTIIETPNRLWFFDEHTSLLPYFNWLPDRIAFDYAKFSERSNFREIYNEYSDEKFLHFLRRGRGMSFHELEIAWDIKAKDIDVVSHLKQFFLPFSKEKKFFDLLQKISPQIDKGFFYPYLNMIIKK